MKSRIPLFFKLLAATMMVAGVCLVFKGFSMLRAPKDEKTVLHSPVKPDAVPLRLTDQHLTLIRRLRVKWAAVELGVPGIDVYEPLIGEGPPLSIAMAALGTTDEAFAVRTLTELSLLIDVFVREGELAPGRYAIPAEMRKVFDYPGSSVSASGHFNLRKEHLTLLKAAQWHVMNREDLDDAIAQRKLLLPFIDGHQPYGDHSLYVIDMAELLGEPYKRDARGELIADRKKDARLEKLHGETLAALQVFLHYATLAQR